ncbi:hypothetical protein ELQ35_17890 [Peribacillus cavernae]|uniref:Uncharacterized protein n=1 Tax=Peribacillus cavernae TaxID=1674310 RepID=A0A3S0VJI7_9BACI|nr:hypothetical protein ELQ35_17890 [Peribacillus cavernae]
MLPSGTVGIQAFKSSPEYEYIIELFEDSFLGNQLFEEIKLLNRSNWNKGKTPLIAGEFSWKQSL